MMTAQGHRYDQDFYAWIQEQATLLREGKLVDLDRHHLAEEIEGLGVSLRRELRSRLTVLVTHRLKWDKQPEYRSRSWKATILHQQQEILDLLEESPSLKPLLPELLTMVYPRAVEHAVTETTVYRQLFPEECPWTVEELLREDHTEERT